MREEIGKLFEILGFLLENFRIRQLFVLNRKTNHSEQEKVIKIKFKVQLIELEFRYESRIPYSNSRIK